MRRGRDVIRVGSLAEYRLPTMRAVVRARGDQLLVQAGDRSPDGTIRVLGPDQLVGLQPLRNVYLPADVLIQFGRLRAALSARTLIVDLNPRALHVWVLLAVRRLARRRTLVWGHAWPRQGSASAPGRLRTAQVRLAYGAVTYTRTQARELRELHPGLPCYPAPNALFAAADCRFEPDRVRDRFIFVGRLVPEKKVDLLLRAFSRASEEQRHLGLTIVGDGPQREQLAALAVELRCEDRVSFVGHEARVETLRSLYASALASVSPGSGGLAITQSLAFGVPVVVARDEPHGPEIEAAEPSRNAVFVASDDTAALAAALIEVADRAEEWAARGAQIAAECARHYSVEAMSAGIVDALAGSETG